MILPNRERSNLNEFKPGTLILIGFVVAETKKLSDGRELRLMDSHKGYYSVIAYKNNRPTSPVDEIVRGVQMVPGSILGTVSRSELPLYVDWKTGRLFAEMMKGPMAFLP